MSCVRKMPEQHSIMGLSR